MSGGRVPRSKTQVRVADAAESQIQEEKEVPSLLFARETSTPQRAISAARKSPPRSSASCPSQAQSAPSLAAATSAVPQGPPPTSMLLSARSLVSSAG